MKKPIVALIGILFFLYFSSSSLAATYYLATNGSDSANGSSAAPFATFTYAWTKMVAGDTLIVKDGTYTQQLRYIPNGTSSNYTNVKAEHNGSVLIDGSAYPSWTYPLDMYNASYIRIEGLKFKSNPTASGADHGVTSVGSSNHLKFIRCAFYGAPENDNQAVVDCTQCSYVLFEECWAWGGGRYKFLSYESDRVIYRRCVARHDYHDPSSSWGRQCAGFTTYDSTNFLFENCIVIDSGRADFSTGTLYGGFWSENNAEVVNSGRILGCILLNIRGLGAINDPKINSTTRIIKDTVVWDCQGGLGFEVQAGSPTVTLDHLTIGNIIGTSQDESRMWGTGVEAKSGFASATVTNSVVYDCDSYGVADYIASNYNDFYSNTVDYGGVLHTPSLGAHDITLNPIYESSTNPTGALKYIVRVEIGSPLKGAASDGGDIGANVIKRYGVAETLYGETGYNILTSDNLWPFPNEDAIRTDMRTYNLHGVSGSRGFCADGTSLTEYIWKYLGNTVPIYYVDPSGSDSNPGTQSLPWRTLQHASDMAVAGDTVLVNDGTYAGFCNWDNSGTSTEPITFKANGSNVIVNSRNPSTADNINIENVDYIVLDGFKVQSAPRAGIRVVNSTGTIVKNCVCSNNTSWGIFTGFAFQVEILDNTCYGSVNEHGIYVSNSNLPHDAPIIRGNTCYSNYQNGIQVNGDLTSGGDGIIQDALIENNIVHDNGWKGLSLISMQDSVVRNNLIYNNGSRGAAGGVHLVEEPGTGQHSSNNLVVNNTIIEPSIAGIRLNTGSTSNTIFNNIVVSSSPIVDEDGGNIIDTTSNIRTASTSGLFVSAASNDYQLLNSSSAKDAGKSSYNSKTAPSQDITGISRPQGSAYDIGAYEVNQGNASPEAPVDPVDSVSGGGGGGGGGGCFIATAAYGSPMANEIIILSRFRDKHLLTNKFGRAFIRYYYRHSPSVARYIEKTSWAKSVARGMLKPVIALIKYSKLDN